MKKSIFVIIGIFLIILSFMIFFRTFNFNEHSSTTNTTTTTSPSLESITFGSGGRDLTLFLDYDSVASREFYRTYSLVLNSIIISNAATLHIKYVPKSDEKYALALYCSYGVGKHWEYTRFLVDNYEKLNTNEGNKLSFITLAVGLGIPENTFGKCLNTGYYKGAINRDVLDFSQINGKRLPMVILDGNELPLETLNPAKLSESIYAENGSQNLVNGVTPPRGGWHREDGGTGALDPSIPTEQRRGNVIK